MASFHQKCSMGALSNLWCKDHSSRETTLVDGSEAASNPSPKSPLDVDFEKETGVTTGLGLVPYLASLCQEDRYDRRIVFGFNIVDHFARSLIEDSVANAFELLTLNPNPSSRLFSYPSTPSSLFSPLSHSPLIGSQPDLWKLPDHPYMIPTDPEYFFSMRDGGEEIDDLSVGSELILLDYSFSEDDLILSENGSEHNYDGSFDGTTAQKTSHFAHEEEDIREISPGANTKTSHIDNNCIITEQPRSFVGGLSATFGIRASRPVSNLEDQSPTTEEIMMRCCFCKKPLNNKEQNGSIFFKYKYTCCSKKCRKAGVNIK